MGNIIAQVVLQESDIAAAEAGLKAAGYTVHDRPAFINFVAQCFVDSPVLSDDESFHRAADIELYFNTQWKPTPGCGFAKGHR